MTEKRFVFDPSISHFDDKVTGKTYCEYNLDKVVDLLNELYDENEQLKQEKPFLKIHNDYFIQYGDDRELFSMHKPSDIRSLIYILNRQNGYSELQCEYNNLEMEENE